jgi:hypothetical protein
MISYCVPAVAVLGLLRGSFHEKWHWSIMSKLVIITLHVTLRGSNYRLPGAVIFATNVLKTAGSHLKSLTEQYIVK